MRRILALTIILTLLAFPVVAQEKAKPLTPEQTVVAALEGMLNWKIKYGKETVFAAEMQVLALSLEREIKKLEAKLKAANAKIAQLETGPKEEKVSDNKEG